MSKNKKTKDVKRINLEQDLDIHSILKALENHIINGSEMSSTQVNAALALLKKALPDCDINNGEKTEILTHEEALKQLE